MPGDSEDSSDITDSSQPSDTTDSSESNDTVDTSGTTDSSESNDTVDTNDTTDSSESNDTVDTSDTTDSSESNDTVDTSDTTDSSGTTSSSDSGNTTKPSTPTIVPDRTQYQPSVVGDKEAIYYINSIVRHPLLTPYYDGYQAALTMTFDDGYDSNTGVIVSDTLERFGYRGTMMLGACFMDSDTIIKEWNDIFARGVLDVGCHGYNHEEPTKLPQSKYEHEIKDAIEFLRAKFPGQRVLTFATPYAHINDAYEDYLSQFVIGNRLEAGGSTINLSQSLSYNPYRVKAVSVNTNVGISNAKTEVELGVKGGKWIVELYHCVKQGASGVDIESSTFVAHCEWLYRNYRDKLWVTTFENVLIYGEQLKHTSVDYTACDRESITITLTPDGTLDKEIYNIPMTLQVYLPDFVDSAYAMINGERIPLETEVIFETAEKYVMVRDIDVTEKTDVVIYLGGNKTMKNNCVHRYSVVETVEPTHDESGYTLNECSKCNHTYYSAFTTPVHDYTGDVEIIIYPQRTLKGCAKHYCTQCDKYIVEDMLYSDFESNAE